MNYWLKIFKDENGYLVEWDDDGEIRFRVFEEGDEEFGDIECFRRLLYFVTEFFAKTGSKHDKKRITITLGGKDE